MLQGIFAEKRVDRAVKRLYPFGNQEIPGEDVEFETEKESFNVYILHDGTRLKLKAVVGQIVRLEVYLPNGDPMYLVNASNIVVTDSPDSLRKKPE